jgi:AMMECR1 domain-containing protein
MTIQTLSDDDRNCLLKLARSAITAELVGGTEVIRPANPSGALQKKCGCFVTLHKDKVLRGCIGTIEAARSLLAGVEHNARNSAFRDPRFPPLEADELPAVDIQRHSYRKSGNSFPTRNPSWSTSALKPVWKRIVGRPASLP